MSIRKGSSIISGSGSSGLPEQAGNAGKILSTDGVTPEWISYNPTPETDGTTISINASDKIQSIGVIEKNNADPKYDWVGTYNEWILGRSTGTINDSWICYITDDDGNVTSSKERTLGEIIFSLIPQDDPALHLLDGSLIDGTGVYNAFYTYMKNLYDNGYDKCFTDETSWQSSVTTYGVCGKFVLDTSNQTIRLPMVEGFVEGTLDEDALGELTEAGLPNITGTLAFEWQGASNGVFEQRTATGNGEYGAGWRTNNNTGFNASKSNSIYGNSNTVQPQSIKGFYYIVLSTSVALDVPLDVNAVVNDVSNLQTEIGGADYVVEYQTPTAENNYTWYRLYKSGWVEQGGHITTEIATVTFLIPMTNGCYTALATGTGNGNEGGSYIDGTCTIYNKTTTGMMVHSLRAVVQGDWEVKGFAAQS